MQYICNILGHSMDLKEDKAMRKIVAIHNKIKKKEIAARTESEK